MEEKKERKMSPKGFMGKLRTKAANDAAGFIKKHRDYLVNGDMAEVTRPIVEQLESGALLPTPAMGEIRQVVTQWVIDSEAAKAAIARSGAGGTKPFTACVLDASGRIVLDDEGKELKKTFNLPQEAQRWADRRLFDLPHTTAEVLHKGSPWETIPREDAIARILKKGPGAVMKRPPRQGSTLRWGVKVREGKATFSHG